MTANEVPRLSKYDTEGRKQRHRADLLTRISIGLNIALNKTGAKLFVDGDINEIVKANKA